MSDPETLPELSVGFDLDTFQEFIRNHSPDNQIAENTVHNAIVAATHQPNLDDEVMDTEDNGDDRIRSIRAIIEDMGITIVPTQGTTP